MGRTAALVRFNEPHDYDRPADLAGNLEPLFAPTGLTAPPLADGIIGRARTWSPTTGYHALEAVAGSTRLLRDVTLEAVVYLPWATTNGAYRILTRGKGTSAPERELYGLQLDVSGAPGAPLVTMRMRWQRADGSAATVPATTFQPPPGWLYLAAVRRWRSPTDVVVDYYVNGAWQGQVATAHGDIVDGVGGTLMIGTDATPVGMPAGSKIDDWRISNAMRTAEEIRQIYRRLFVYPGYAFELLKSLQPPGKTWPQSDDSKIQRFFAVAGDALAVPWSLAAELLEDFLPDRAWSFLDRWETITRLAPRAADSIETRRARVAAFVRKVHGYTRAEMLDNVAPLLDADVGDLVFVEGSTTLLDDFDGVLLKPYWTVEPATLADPFGLNHPPTVFGNEVYWDNLAINSRWDGTHREAALIRTSIAAEEGVHVQLDVTRVTQGNGSAIGLFVLNRITGDAHLFGTKGDAGALKWWHATIISGVYSETLGAAVPGAGGGGSPSDHTWLLRYRDRGGGFADLDVQVDGHDMLGTFVHLFENVPTISGRAWAGLFISDTTAPSGGGFQLHASAFRIFAPASPIAFEWAIYRDPALGGAPDFGAARQVIQKTKPAHTRGEIIESLTFTYDTAPSYWDRSLWGA